MERAAGIEPASAAWKAAAQTAIPSTRIVAAVRRGPVGSGCDAFARRALPYVTASPRAVQDSPAKAIPNRCRCGVCGARRGAQRQPSGCTGIDLLGIAGSAMIRTTLDAAPSRSNRLRSLISAGYVSSAGHLRRLARSSSRRSWQLRPPIPCRGFCI